MALQIRRRARDIAEHALDPSILTLRLIKDAAEAIDVPFLKGVTGLLLIILEVVAKAKANIEACKRLAERAGRIVLEICKQTMGIAIDPQMRRNIAYLEDTLTSIQAFVLKQTARGRISRFFQAEAIADLVAIHDQRLNDAIQLFQTQTLLADNVILHRVETRVTAIQDAIEEAPKAQQYYQGLPILDWNEITLGRQLRQGPGYRIHSATYRGQSVQVKVFEGVHASQFWKYNTGSNCIITRNIWHPNVLRMIATSSSLSDPHFVLFNAATDRNIRSIECRIASMLKTDLAGSVKLGFNVIRDLATALDYMSKQGVSLGSIGIENFDLFIGENDKVIVGINVDSESPNSQYGSLSSDDEGWNILQDLCRKTLNAANQILYHDHIERKSSDHDRFEELTELSPNSVDQPLARQQLTSASVPETRVVSPRREFLWKPLERGGSSLAEVSRQFGDFMDVFFSTSMSTPLPRFRGRDVFRTSHRCKGYVREEITLTTNIWDSAIVTHSTPSPREVCTVCKEPVEEGFFRCACGEHDDGIRATIQCTRCSEWQHSDCVSPHSPKHYMCNNCRYELSLIRLDEVSKYSSLTDGFNEKGHAMRSPLHESEQSTPSTWPDANNHLMLGESFTHNSISWPRPESPPTLPFPSEHPKTRKHGPRNSLPRIGTARPRVRKYSSSSDVSTDFSQFDILEHQERATDLRSLSVIVEDDTLPESPELAAIDLGQHGTLESDTGQTGPSVTTQSPGSPRDAEIHTGLETGHFHSFDLDSDSLTDLSEESESDGLGHVHYGFSFDSELPSGTDEEERHHRVGERSRHPE